MNLHPEHFCNVLIGCALLTIGLCGCTSERQVPDSAKDTSGLDVPQIDDGAKLWPGEEELLDKSQTMAWDNLAEDIFVYESPLEVSADYTNEVPSIDSQTSEVDFTLDSDNDGLPDWHEALIGSDPLSPDTDRDGVSDGTEVLEGTDPVNPASAKAWHPEWTEHPRLFFSPNEIDLLRAKAGTKSGPLAVLLARIMSSAEKLPLEYPKDGTYDILVSAQWGEIAEAAAFLALLFQDRQLAERAVDLMARGFPDPFGLDPKSNYDLLEAEALVSFCTAWDYLAGNSLVTPEMLLKAREGLIKRLDTFRSMCHEGPVSYLLMLSRNNHPMKVFGALGLCAIALNDRPEAAVDLSEAMTGLDFLLNIYQSTPDGGYAEGWHYLQYGSESYLPFIVAYHRYAKGESLPYFGVPTLQIESPYALGVHFIQDFATNPVTKAVFTTALWAARPDGLLPETDDANPARLHGAILARIFEDPRFLWNWFKPAVGFYSGRLSTATFALYDGSQPPADFGKPLEGSLYEAGFAIFRESWEDEAVYLLLQGEHGTVRVHGEGHEHADELSLMIRAFGRPLLLDPGYIDWSNHSLVMYPKDHNTILVDGKGAPISEWLPFAAGADAFLTPMRHDQGISRVAVKTFYEGVHFQRRVVRVAPRVFVVEDRMNGDNVRHNYTILWNGAGGGDIPDSSFIQFGDGARWENGEAYVEVRTTPVAGGPGNLSHHLEEHATSYGSFGMHEQLQVESFMDSPAGFLTLIVVGRHGDSEKVSSASVALVRNGVAEARWELEDKAVMVVSNQTAEDVQIEDWVAEGTAKPGLTVFQANLHGSDDGGPAISVATYPPVEPDYGG